MSWKGFQKAIARLPQIVKQKTGLAEGTVDEEFKELGLTYTRIKQDTTKFLNECISYKAAMLNLLNFQVSLMEEHHWNLSSADFGDSKNGSLDDYLHNLQNLRTELADKLEDSVDKLLIKPLTEYQLLLVKVDSIIKKRNNKLLDYDRNRLAYDKMVNNPSRRNEMSEEKKILKQEQALNQATLEYDRYNNLLKIELPHLLDLRSQLLKPGIQTLLAYQKLFYTKSAAIFAAAPIIASLNAETLLKSTEQKFEKEVEPIMKEIRNMGMFHGTGLKYSETSSPSLSSTSSLNSSSTAAVASNNYENPPDYSSLNTKSGLTATLGESKQQPAVIQSTLQPNKTVKSAAPKPPPSTAPKSTSTSSSSNKHYVQAIYDFSSEDSEDLSFKMGDLIEVLDSSDQYGWWVGKDSKGNRGNFPSNYVTEKN